MPCSAGVGTAESGHLSRKGRPPSPRCCLLASATTDRNARTATVTCDDTRTLKFTLIVQRSAAEDLGGDLGLFGASGRRFLDALVAGERSPKALAALGDPRLKATPQQLAAALTGRFREVHAFEIAMHLRLIDAINDEVARLDARIEQQLTSIPGVAPACTACGLIGGPHSPGCASARTRPSWAWWNASMRSPESAPATPRSSSPSSAPTCRCSPPPGTPPPRPA